MTFDERKNLAIERELNIISAESVRLDESCRAIGEAIERLREVYREEEELDRKIGELEDSLRLYRERRTAKVVTLRSPCSHQITTRVSEERVFCNVCMSYISPEEVAR